MSKRYYRLIGFLIVIIILSRVDLYKIFGNLSRVNVLAFFLINLLLIPVIFLKSLRWKCILGFQSIYYSHKEAFLVYLSGIYAGLATPGRIGEAFKALCLKDEKGVALSRGLGTIFIDRLCDLYLLLSLGLFGIWRFCPGFNNWPALAIMALFLIGVAFALTNNRRLTTWLTGYLQNIGLFKKHKIRFKFHYEEFYSSIESVNITRLLLLAGITLASGLLYFWQCYFLISLLGFKMPFLTIIFFIPVVNLVSLLPITVAGIGTREASLVYLFSLVGLGPEKAIAASFLIFVSFYVITGILGFVGWHIRR